VLEESQNCEKFFQFEHRITIVAPHHVAIIAASATDVAPRSWIMTARVRARAPTPRVWSSITPSPRFHSPSDGR
jgi:hypothetical protein